MKTSWFRYWPVLAAVVVILLCLAYWGQLSSPYIEHDDWDFLLPQGWGHGYASPWQKTLSEGRWLNYLWYLGIGGAHWSPQRAVRTFLGLTIVFACALGYVKERPWTTCLAILVAFFAPAFGALSTWPSVLSASACVLALAVLCLRFASARWRLVALGVSTFLSIMSYAGVAPVVLLAHVYLGKVNRLRPLLATLVVYLACYALSVLCIATLNYCFHDHFGLKIEGWRHAHPPQDLHELWLAGLHQLASFAESMAFLWGPCLIWALAVIALLREPAQRGTVLVLLVVSALALGIDVGLSSLNGMTVPFRAMEWVWIALMLPMLLLVVSGRRIMLFLGGAGLLWMLLLGVGFWNGVYRSRGPAGDYVYALARDLSKVLGPRPAVLVGDITSVRQLRPLYLKPELQLRMALLKLRDITAVRCEPSLCAAAKAYAQTHRITTLMFEYQGHEIIYFRPGAALGASTGPAPPLPPAPAPGSPRP